MEAIKEAISLWGGVASILALLGSVVGGCLLLLGRAKKRYSAELLQLEALRNSVADRVRAATTQGKRIDLFLYYHSRLSTLRSFDLAAEVRLCCMHLMSIAILLFLLALDANADYFADRAFGTLALLYNRYGIVYVVTFVLLLAFNVHARYVLAKFRKRLAAISEPLVDELKQVVDEKIGT